MFSNKRKQYFVKKHGECFLKAQSLISIQFQFDDFPNLDASYFEISIPFRLFIAG